MLVKMNWVGSLIVILSARMVNRQRFQYGKKYFINIKNMSTHAQLGACCSSCGSNEPPSTPIRFRGGIEFGVGLAVPSEPGACGATSSGGPLP